MSRLNDLDRNLVSAMCEHQLGYVMVPYRRYLELVREADRYNHSTSCKAFDFIEKLYFRFEDFKCGFRSIRDNLSEWIAHVFYPNIQLQEDAIHELADRFDGKIPKFILGILKEASCNSNPEFFFWISESWVI